MNNKKTYIFDFDGTLVDSMPVWGEKMLYVLNKRRLSYPDDIVKTLTPLGDKGSAEYFLAHLGATGSIEALIADMDEYALEKYLYEIPLKATVKETLALLKAHGCSLNVLTASPHRMLDPCLKRVGLYDLFDNVWSCEDFGTTKSDVTLYHTVANRLNVRVQDCVFLDDNVYALSVAKQSGMQIVGVYDAVSADSEQQIRAIADQYIREFAQLKY